MERENLIIAFAANVTMSTLAGRLLIEKCENTKGVPSSDIAFMVIFDGGTCNTNKKKLASI